MENDLHIRALLILRAENGRPLDEGVFRIRGIELILRRGVRIPRPGQYVPGLGEL